MTDDVKTLLQKNEELNRQCILFQAMFDAAPDQIYLFDSDIKYLYANSAGARALGLEVPEILCKTRRETGRAINRATSHAEESVEPFETDIRKVFKTGWPVRGETELLVNGETGYFEHILTPIRDQAGKVCSVLANVRDKTQRRLIEEELTYQRNLLQTVSESTPECLYILDQEMNYLFISPSVEKALDLNSDEILSRNWQDLTFPANVMEPFAAKIKEVFETGKTVYTESQFRVGGESRYYEDVLTPVPTKPDQVEYMLVSARDITKRKWYEEALKETMFTAEKRANELDVIFSSITNGLIVYDKNGNISRMNEVAREAFGYIIVDDDKYLKEQGVQVNVCLPDGTPFKLEEIPSYLAIHEEVVRNVEMQIVKNLGTSKWLTVSSAPLKDPTGEISGAILTFSDTTKRRQAEDRINHQSIILNVINQVHEKAIQCETMEELGQACLNIIENITNSKFSFIGEVGPDGLHHDIAIGDPGWELCKMYDKTGHRRSPGNFNIRGLYGRILLDGKSLLTNDPTSHLDSVGVPEGHPPLTAFLGVPFVHGGKVIGMIGVANREGGYRREDQEILEALTPTILEAILRKRAEEEQQRTAAMLEAIGNSTPDSIFVKDLDGRMLYASPGTMRVVHKTADQILGRIDTQGHLNFEEARVHMANDRQVMESGQTQVIEEIFTDSQGAHVFLSTKSPLRNAAGQVIGLVGLSRDITERKQAERALQVKQEELTVANEKLQAQREELTANNEELQVQQEELTANNEELRVQQDELNTNNQKLQRQADESREDADAANRECDEAERRAQELDATLSAIAAGIIIYDNSGNINHINEIARNMLGYLSDDQNVVDQERRVRLNLCKSDGSPYEAEETPLFRALRGEIIRDEEIMIAMVPEKPVWLSATLAPIQNYKNQLIGVIFTFTDITDRKRKAEDLLTSEREFLKVTLNSLGEGVLAIDREERIIFINQAAANLTGYSQEEAIGEGLNKIFYVLDDKTSEPIAIISSQAALGHPVLVTRDLKEVAVAMNSAPIKATDGRIIGTVIVFQDISEKLKIEQELLKAAKLDSLGILAGGVAHDFNNILAGILANLQLAAIKQKKHQDISKYLEDTITISRKASDLTKQLLTFAKGGDPVKKSAAIANLVKDTVQFALSGSKVKAVFHLPEELWAVDIDEGQITQVINNLTINAEQAMPTGGIIEINGENVVFETGDQYNPGQYVKLTVKDYGIGIPGEIIHQIFDPFFTTKKTGNGLGLSTSYSIIKKHDGYLEVESAPGSGTTFYIYLPASMSELIIKDVKKELAACGEAKILLMDDEDIIRNVGGEMLSCFGYRVTLARDGQEAIDLFKKAKETGEPFDIVIMDLTVPGGLGGIESMTILRQIEPEIKAIISSGYASDPVMSDYERFGFNGVVIKPYKFDELNEVLNKVIDKKQLPLDFTY